MSKSSGASVLWTILLIGLVIYLIFLLIMWAAKVFVFFGYNFLFFFDNLIHVAPLNPVVIWGVIGLFLGSIVGVIVAVKKLKLSKLLILYPLMGFLLLISIMGFINKPAKYGTSRFTGEEKKSTPTTSVRTYYILNTDANVRSGPSINYSKLFVLKKGTEVQVIHKNYYDNRSIEWFIILYDGKEGYCSSKLMEYSRTEN